MTGEWSFGLCDCFGDFHTCCLTFWCPCVTFGRTAEIVDRGSTSCCMNGTLYYLLSTIGCQWLYAALLNARAIQLERVPLHRLLHSLLVWPLRALPGVQGAGETRLQHGQRMGR